MENKKNQNTLSEQSNLQSRELSDQELEQAAGGQGDINGSAATEWQTDYKGRVTHWKKESGEIYHFTCPTCGRILHKGTLGYLYCDPCDDWFTAAGANKVIDKASDRTWPF